MKQESVRILERMTKALTSVAVAGFAKRARMEAQVAAHQALENKSEETVVTKPSPEPELGVSYTRSSHEPPVVPVRHVEPPAPEVRKSETVEECGTCGYVRKSTTATCPVCDRHNSGESTPIWRR